MMDFQLFASQVAQMKQLLDAQGRVSLDVYITLGDRRVRLSELTLQDDGSGFNNLDVVLVGHHDPDNCPRCGSDAWVPKAGCPDCGAGPTAPL